MTNVDAQAVWDHVRAARPAMTSLLAELARAESPRTFRRRSSACLRCWLMR
jgi:hypothetical protein